MRFDIDLLLRYTYSNGGGIGRNVLRVVPANIDGLQRLVAGSLSIHPKPSERIERIDFFGNTLVEAVFDDAYRELDFSVRARVERFEKPDFVDVSEPVARIADSVRSHPGLDANSPHHFIAPSPRVPFDVAISSYAHSIIDAGMTTFEAVEAVGLALHRDMQFDAEATTVETEAKEAFDQRRGVCQDFSHIMIAALRALGIPAGYVSGYLRTLPPPGEPKLEGADAMHAWVRAWCGYEMGWVEYDPTNAMFAGTDHIVVGYGRDYSDVPPIKGMLRLSGSQTSEHSVDVREVD